MRIRMLGSSFPGGMAGGDCQYLTSFLINDTVAIDAGSLGYRQPVELQARVGHVLLTHSHADHVGSLPIFIENTLSEDSVVRIGATKPVLECLRGDVFNDRIWPDFVNMTRDEGGFLELLELRHEVPVSIDGLTITPVQMDHVVPTVGFVIQDGHANVIIAGDTGPTERIWKFARGLGTVDGVFLEASFPDEEVELARVSAHLTPQQFCDEVDKLGHPTRAIAYHIKAKHRERVVAQLERRGVEVGIPDEEYVFP